MGEYLINLWEGKVWQYLTMTIDKGIIHKWRHAQREYWINDFVSLWQMGGRGIMFLLCGLKYWTRLESVFSASEWRLVLKCSGRFEKQKQKGSLLRLLNKKEIMFSSVFTSQGWFLNDLKKVEQKWWPFCFVGFQMVGATNCRGHKWLQIVWNFQNSNLLKTKF